MKLYRNVNISFQVGCEVDDEIAKKLIAQTRNECYEISLKALNELLRLTDKSLDKKIQFIYDEINELSSFIYIPNRDYRTDDCLEDEEGSVIGYEGID